MTCCACSDVVGGGATQGCSSGLPSRYPSDSMGEDGTIAEQCASPLKVDLGPEQRETFLLGLTVFSTIAPKHILLLKYITNKDNINEEE